MALYALTAAILVVNSDTESASADTERLTIGEIEVRAEGSTLVLTGHAPSVEATRGVIEALLDDTAVTAAINRVRIDPTAAPPTVTDRFINAVESLRGAA